MELDPDSGKDCCFVIMPFNEHFDEYYDELFVPAIEDAELVAERADRGVGAGLVMKTIWKKLESSLCLLAELGDENVNVFYEVGIAHAMYKPVCLIRRITHDKKPSVPPHLPFDISGFHFKEYRTWKVNWQADLKFAITNRLLRIKENPEDHAFYPLGKRISIEKQDWIERQAATASSSSDLHAQDGNSSDPRVETAKRLLIERPALRRLRERLGVRYAAEFLSYFMRGDAKGAERHLDSLGVAGSDRREFLKLGRALDV